MLFLLLSASAILYGSTADDSLADCPYGLVKDNYLKAYGNYCYRFVLNDKKDYTDAAKDCGLIAKGTLALAKSKLADRFLFKELRNFQTKEEAWIGLSDRKLEDTFVWEDGTVLSRYSYSNFAPEEGPRKSFIQSKIEDCVAIDPEEFGKWRDYRCESLLYLFDSAKNYICQYKKATKISDN